MPLKLNMSEKGKAWRLELENNVLAGKKIGDTVQGSELSADLGGYEMTITGGTDKAGFAHKPGVEGPELKKMLLRRGWGQHKKKQGLRLRKTYRGEQLGEKTVQVNFTITKTGTKPLPEIFPDQNKAPEPEKPAEEAPAETPQAQSDQQTAETTEQKTEEIKEEIAEEVKEEIKDDIPTSPETKTEEQKDSAAEKVADEVAEEVQGSAEKIAEDEKKE